MKSKEEVQQLADEFTTRDHAHYFYRGRDAYLNGYIQCQQDIIELLRVEIHRAFIHGQGNAQMMEAGLERDEVEEYVNWRMLSLNKQD
jgi:hypothetical protein